MIFTFFGVSPLLLYMLSYFSLFQQCTTQNCTAVGRACISNIACTRYYICTNVIAVSICNYYIMTSFYTGCDRRDNTMSTMALFLLSRQVEMVVGKALATDGDPDYDSENPLYNGAATMIRPYPLPKSAKAAKAAVEGEGAEGVVIPAGAGGGSSTASSDYEAKDDPELQDDNLSAIHSEYAGPADLEMIVEESEEDRTSSRYSETRYSEASRYSDTYSDYGDRPSRQHVRQQHAPSR